MIKHITPIFIIILFCGLTSLVPAAGRSVERWDYVELAFEGTEAGNPFVGHRFEAEFRNGGAIRTATGFYDGEDVWRIRFMPDETGEWSWTTSSDIASLDGQTGKFECVAASENNHGPVRVRDQFHFEYADGTPFYPFGTTVYGFTHQVRDLDKQTLETLADAPFNKVRFLVLPYGDDDPDANPAPLLPFEGSLRGNFDYSRFNIGFFRNLERNVRRLRDLGIEADLIIFNPYDRGRWGFDEMPGAVDDAFLEYLVARLSAFRNVWWCMANEFSYMDAKTMDDWDRLFQIVEREDPYGHLRSIHNADILYDYKKPWVTHVALQYYNAVRFERAASIFRDVYGKPVVNDEVNYEGNITQRWGRLSGEEMSYRAWEAIVNGTYITHGETLRDGDRKATWISRGGALEGESPARIAFLRSIVEELGPQGLEPQDPYFFSNLAGVAGQKYLYYFGKDALTEWEFRLPRAKKILEDGMQFHAEVIDTWNMTCEPVEGVFEIEQPGKYDFLDKQRRKIKLPGRPYMAIIIRNLDETEADRVHSIRQTLDQHPDDE